LSVAKIPIPGKGIARPITILKFYPLKIIANTFIVEFGASRGNAYERLFLHLQKKFGSDTFSDWEVFLEIIALSYSQALKIEKKIKSMKSKKHIRKLPEMLGPLGETN